MRDAANDPSRIPPLDERQLERLRKAYDGTQLAQNGRSFDDAIADDLMRRALANIADAQERRRALQHRG